MGDGGWTERKESVDADVELGREKGVPGRIWMEMGLGRGKVLRVADAKNLQLSRSWC